MKDFQAKTLADLKNAPAYDFRILQLSVELILIKKYTNIPVCSVLSLPQDWSNKQKQKHFVFWWTQRNNVGPWLGG